MSLKHLDIVSLRGSFNLKLKELEAVFRTQSDLQEKKDAALENEIESLNNILAEKEKALRKCEREKKKLFEDLQDCEEENLKLRDKIDERDETIMTLKEDFIEKSRDQMKNADRRVENVKLELSGDFLNFFDLNFSFFKFLTYLKFSKI